jgi:hypothetical protein
MERTDFPWSPLGALLVDEGLVTASDLGQALAEHRRTGRLLGQILVRRGYVTAATLAQALAKQHGVDVRAVGEAGRSRVSESSSDPTGADHPLAWRPLGRLLVAQGLVTETALQQALAEQRETEGRRLGEILVADGYLSGRALAQALAAQHGVAVETEEFAPETETVTTLPNPGEPTYHVWDVAYEPAYQRVSILYETSNFLEAADFACDFVDGKTPEALEIERRDGTASETVWTYSEARAEATAASRKSTVETFGFDPTRWGTSL